ncbi:MAG: DnaJ domain-containing protein [Actinomycetota bacterium]|nr:DnaJ domain-containing protein [Actinomycetota bacterium]
MKELITFKDVDNARKVLELSDVSSIENIKNSYRKLILKYHPDKYYDSQDKDTYEEKVKEINNSYKIIMNYCLKYPISLNRDKVKDVEDGEYIEDHLKRFYDGWVSDK